MKALIRKDNVDSKQDAKRIKLIRKLLEKPEFARSDEEQSRLAQLMSGIEYFHKRKDLRSDEKKEIINQMKFLEV